jgi:hypothetical protein
LETIIIEENHTAERIKNYLEVGISHTIQADSSFTAAQWAEIPKTWSQVSKKKFPFRNFLLMEYM